MVSGVGFLARQRQGRSPSTQATQATESVACNVCDLAAQAHTVYRHRATGGGAQRWALQGLQRRPRMPHLNFARTCEAAAADARQRRRPPVPSLPQCPIQILQARPQTRPWASAKRTVEVEARLQWGARAPSPSNQRLTVPRAGGWCLDVQQRVHGVLRGGVDVGRRPMRAPLPLRLPGPSH
jgi:hypothetical protein